MIKSITSVVLMTLGQFAAAVGEAHGAATAFLLLFLLVTLV